MVVGGEPSRNYLVRRQPDAEEKKSMTGAVRLGIIVPSVNIVVEEWYPRVDGLGIG